MKPTLTILMPCLNEAQTVAACIAIARTALSDLALEGEVLIADNGSSDNSAALAEAAGARVINVSERGYGAALRAGIADAKGEYVIFGDCDLSYDFSAAGIRPYIEALNNGAELVMGNRFKGSIKPGAMPPLHRYFGTPFMTIMVNLMFGTRVGDINCGLRGLKKTSFMQLPMQCTGMEFASEMFIRSAMAGFVITEVPIVLSPDQRNRKPHLRSFRDGFRHMGVWWDIRFGITEKLKALHQKYFGAVIAGERGERLANSLLEVMPNSPISILDVGCGNGMIAARLMSLNPKLSITGVEVAKYEHCAIPCQTYDGHNLPFPDGHFDYAMLINVLHHSNSPLALLKEAARVSRSGVIVKDHYSNSKLDYYTLMLMDIVGNAFSEVNQPYHYLSEKEWPELFRTLGLSVEKLHTKFISYGNKLVNSLCGRNLHFIALLKK